ncbi:hypothetical protein A3195_11260 [Candidatus Thiodiazotropha endoloripes]|uniref:DUF4870 family protein n=1 Tax=Candidatus Thiodiazotropha endoloripes TaxID=1818881 RepID=UPI00083DA2A7|nr:hypothetical protein [Candidatus Thiodiazotropha endoloripes]MCG7902149.1 hypothetical protein [Candidatus Thiodiazotropha weberae]MCG7913980.1 hypothetical protein [Candidatus Thiodiazotropha weberae]ODB86214.1 hypothetical protein A3195_11260 [Candidatus Thiodiazotropha endoloripes]ODB88248.1 hypothetical protein A3193_05065 [Candidatus Thiodiazotropha endoloripes]ODB89695.1 hypothetical protein A3194_11125 [Candidatus Thiodiazotropha endoloripes]
MNTPIQDQHQNLEREVTLTVGVYALQAASFLFVITLLIGVIINYVKRDDVKGTWLESHFRWQIRTFWFVLLWSIIGFITTVILIGYVILFVNAVWLIYRIAKGWLSLQDEKRLYPENSVDSER